MTDRLHEIMGILERQQAEGFIPPDTGELECRILGIAETARAIMALDGWRDIAMRPASERPCWIGHAPSGDMLVARPSKMRPGAWFAMGSPDRMVSWAPTHWMPLPTPPAPEPPAMTRERQILDILRDKIERDGEWIIGLEEAAQAILAEMPADMDTLAAALAAKDAALREVDRLALVILNAVRFACHDNLAAVLAALKATRAALAPAGKEPEQP